MQPEQRHLGKSPYPISSQCKKRIANFLEEGARYLLHSSLFANGSIYYSLLTCQARAWSSQDVTTTRAQLRRAAAVVCKLCIKGRMLHTCYFPLWKQSHRLGGTSLSLEQFGPAVCFICFSCRTQSDMCGLWRYTAFKSFRIIAN